MKKYKTVNKLKIINDPVYGFINIPSEQHFDLIQHPYFQRLRRLKQLGLSFYVYPGATHTRFDHVLGSMHLMSVALRELERKGTIISDEEKDAVLFAILLHDIGHGPLSHSLEGVFVKGVDHEALSLIFMNRLNNEFNGFLSLGIEIFKGNYNKQFLHDLVSSQLDMDRLDYLKRDSFYTGVTEGGIGTDRILKMLKVVNDQIAVEEKGIYSVEQFIIARRIMYWQVYLHKTVIASEVMMKKAIKRASDLFHTDELFATPALAFFLRKKETINNIHEIDDLCIDNYAKLDDSDIIVSMKEWMNHSDKVLSLICKSLINRNLFKVELSTTAFNKEKIIEIKKEVIRMYNLDAEAADYLVVSDKIQNKAYNTDNDTRINIILKTGKLSDIAKASDLNNINTLSKTVEKYFLCYPKLY